MPAITGKLELEYEGEMKGADFVARYACGGGAMGVVPSASDATAVAGGRERARSLDMSPTQSGEGSAQHPRAGTLAAV